MRTVLVIRKDEPYHLYGITSRCHGGAHCNRIRMRWDRLLKPCFVELKKQNLNMDVLNSKIVSPNCCIMPVDSDDFISPEAIIHIHQNDIRGGAIYWNNINWNVTQNIIRPTKRKFRGKISASNMYGLITPTPLVAVLNQNAAGCIRLLQSIQFTCPGMKVSSILSLSNLKHASDQQIVNDVIQTQAHCHVPVDIPDMYQQACQRILDIFKQVTVL